MDQSERDEGETDLLDQATAVMGRPMLKEARRRKPLSVETCRTSTEWSPPTAMRSFACSVTEALTTWMIVGSRW